MYARTCMPIRTALVALPLLFLLSMAPRESTAQARESDSVSGRPAAALVAPADPRDRDGTDEGLTPFGLAALVGIGLVPAFVLVSRRRQQRQPN
jgi:hypothetical protein